MKLFQSLAALACSASVFSAASAQDADGEARSLKLYDQVVFYDGYNDNVFDADKGDGILRHRNNLYAIRLTDEQLAWFGSDLTLKIDIGALCDNYDRIGNVNLAFTPKGADSYDWQTATRVELARFITPFMNKNRKPTVVPYSYVIDAASYIFRDSHLRSAYDLWLEFELFGIPYAANEQISGCQGRNDVFDGTLAFESLSAPQQTVDNHVFVPIVIKRPEYQGNNLNNYSEGGTDEIGRCIKTWTFDVPEDVADARITFIISNHGANAGGEEYVRRLHRISVDGEVVMEYTPGGVSCEPYRRYNTQTNGIYSYIRPESFWKTYSNWCPGAAIPVRELNLGAVAKGTHTFTVEVPEAQFADKQGDFPVSAYFQGLTEGQLPAGIYSPEAIEPDVRIAVEGDVLTWQSDTPVQEVLLYSASGKLLRIVPGDKGCMSVSQHESGVYIVSVRCTDGTTATRKITR